MCFGGAEGKGVKSTGHIATKAHSISYVDILHTIEILLVTCFFPNYKSIVLHYFTHDLTVRAYWRSRTGVSSGCHLSRTHIEHHHNHLRTGNSAFPLHLRL